jgi:hypothetical protein
MLRGCWLAAVLLSLPLAADDLALVPIGASWRWFKGRAEPSSPPEAWRQPGFNDWGWALAPSGFAFDYWGYEATVIYDSPRDYSSVYFRRQFSVDNPTNITWLILRVGYDGGFVAYLNGVEILRRGLPGEPGGTVPHDAPAEYHAGGTPEELDVTPFAPLLTPGFNTLAIQWHNSMPTYYGAAFVPELAANFTRGPFVQNTSTDHQQIIWKTPLAGDTVVEFGQTPALGLRYADPAPVTNHVAILTNLAAGTTYYYRVSTTANGATASSLLTAFKTLKLSGPLTFVLAADIGRGSLAQYAIAQVMENAHPDLVLLAGDIIYPYLTAARADFRCFSVYRNLMRTTPFFITAGNHDVVYTGQRDYLDLFYLPTNSVPPEVHQAAGTAPEAYYSFDHGEAHFVALFVPLLYGNYNLTNGSPQALWLEQDLAATTKPWKFIFLHHPVFSSGAHRHSDYNHNGIPDDLEVAGVLLPIAKRYGVQMILYGHDHVYERFNPVQGVHCMLSGGGGGTLYYLTKMVPESAQFWARYNCIKFTVDSDSLALEALDDKGGVFDTMFLRRTPPPRQVYAASWNSPVFELGRADDGDGNIVGQQFDFTGPAIPTMPGEFSNLGRVYVNYDHTCLYVGLEQTMFYADNNLFLFIESPRLPGVTSLAGLGNGIVDPEGEGADGLDFLENLSFTNFAPNLACILGDEFADGQFRSFVRTNQTALAGNGNPANPGETSLGLNIGQGAFRLEAGLGDVPGLRLQQFNRSPQSTPVPGEQNANFIKLAIPLSELALRPGDRLRLGAVVGGGAFCTNRELQTRYLDRSFLGYSLSGSGQAPVVLEGLEVELGPDLDPDGDGLLTEEELRLGTDPANPDTDGDGLPDGWELRFSFDPLSAAGVNGADGDPDGDGLTNAEEFAAGTDPREPQSGFRLAVAVLANGRVRVSWQAVPGRTYYLQQADSLGSAFTDLPGPGFPRVAVSTVESYEEPMPEPSAARFFRARLIRE